MIKRMPKEDLSLRTCACGRGAHFLRRASGRPESIGDGREAAMAFVDRRIENVMAFEKWKATGGFRPGDWLSQAARTLGKMRYGATPSS